jgi:hypothetical protein
MQRTARVMRPLCLEPERFTVQKLASTLLAPAVRRATSSDSSSEFHTVTGSFA